jgi:hypothetical protein
MRWAALAAVGCLTLLLAMPALGDLVIRGVEDGQVVRGDLSVSVQTNNHRTLYTTLQLVGPTGVVIERRTERNWLHLIDGDGPGRAGLWDSTRFPEGRYRLTVESRYASRSGFKDEDKTISFLVDHPEADGDTRTITGNGTGSGSGSAATPDSDVAQPSPAAGGGSSAPLQVGFAASTPSQRNIGDTQPFRVTLRNTAADSDVLVIAWNHDEREVVRDWAVLLDRKNRVTGDDLDRLPQGNLELQALYRVNGRVVEIAKHSFVQSAEPGALPAITFADNAARSVQLGAAQAMSVEIDGPLPDNADVLVLAWSLDRSELVSGFAHTLGEAPHAISAAKLETLPEGRVELQLRPRIDGQIVGKVVNTVDVRGPATAGLPDPTPPTQEPITEEPRDELTPPPLAGAPAQPTPGDAGTPPAVQPGDDNNAAPQQPITAVPSVKVAFAADLPSVYEQGSGQTLALELNESLPAKTDVLLLAWHHDLAQMVEGFPHALDGAPLRVQNTSMDALTPGFVELQALLRVDGRPIQTVKRTLEVVAAAADPEPEPTVEPEQPADGIDPYTGLAVTDEGFTQFTKSEDTRVIYVSQDGDDDNDGLSPATPLRTPMAGYHKLRRGYPDWLLFKAGDTFTGKIDNLSKHGRSPSERQVIGVYGEGPRPKMLVYEGTWIGKNFQSYADNLAIVGLHLVAAGRDPDDPNWTGAPKPNAWAGAGIGILGKVDSVLMEDLVIEHFSGGIVLQSDENHGYQTNMVVRRCVIIDSYGHWDSSVGGHSQGMYVQYTKGLVIDETVIDRNGWEPRVEGAQRTKFNHNIYVQTCAEETAIRNSIITRGSSHGLQLRGGGEVYNNLFVGNALGFFTALRDSVIRSNVVLKSDDIDLETAPRGYGFSILPCLNAVVENNIVSQKVGEADFAEAIGVVWERPSIEWLDGRDFKVTLRDNKIYQWPRYDGRDSSLYIDGAAKVLANERNALDTLSGGSDDPPWVDPERDVESYMATLGKPASLDAFVDAAANRPRGVWYPQYTADAVNHYIRRGFDTAPHD